MNSLEFKGYWRLRVTISLTINLDIVYRLFSFKHIVSETGYVSVVGHKVSVQLDLLGKVSRNFWTTFTGYS